MTPTAEHLLKQAIRLARGQFDMRCADAVAARLAEMHDHHGPLAYGLLIGMVVSYTRPFTRSDPSARSTLSGRAFRTARLPKAASRPS
jgi:hypothetical protein